MDVGVVSNSKPGPGDRGLWNLSAAGRNATAAAESRAFQVFVEEVEDRLPALDLVFLLGEAVPFVGEDDVLDRHAVLPGGGDDVVGLRLYDPRVVGPLQDHERLLYLIGVDERRDGEQHFAVFHRVADLLVERLALRLPPLRDRFEGPDPVGDAEEIDAHGGT